MRSLMLIAIIASVLGSAVWAYQQNYRTRAVLDEIQRVERDIAMLESRRAVLEAEWAYLNRPDRLKLLADKTFQLLELSPFQPEQFARMSELPFPPQPDAMPVRLAESQP